MSNWTEEQQEQYEQGNDGGYTPPKGSLDWAEQPTQPEPAPKGTEAWTEQNSGGNAPEPLESKEPPKTDVAPPADKPAGVSPHNDTMGYDQLIAVLQEAANRVKPETEEERKKRERREKSAKIVSAISDGMQALSNLFFTTRGAPNMYDHKEASQLTPLQQKLEKLKAERQANADRYLQYSLKIGDAQNERAKTLREMEAQQERAKLAMEKAQREQEEHVWLAALQPDKQREQAGKATKAEQEAVTAKAEADNSPDLYKAKVDTEKARGEAQRASAASSRAAATDHYASARAHDRSNNNEFSAWDENGREYKFRTAAAAEAFAKQHGTFEETDVTSSTTDSETNGKSTTTYKKKSGYAKRAVPDNTPPSRRRGGNKDNTPPSRRR
jgi:GGDEF domain-containing protein